MTDDGGDDINNNHEDEVRGTSNDKDPAGYICDGYENGDG